MKSLHGALDMHLDWYVFYLKLGDLFTFLGLSAIEILQLFVNVFSSWSLVSCVSDRGG